MRGRGHFLNVAFARSERETNVAARHGPREIARSGSSARAPRQADSALLHFPHLHFARSAVRPALPACLLAAATAAFVAPAPANDAAPCAHPAALAVPAARDGSRDFDFEIGRWKTHVTRRLHPLSGSDTWADYDGVTTVNKVWGGAANLLELAMDGNGSHWEGLSLRLYDPQAQQWSLNFCNRAGGTLGTPTVGAFRDGRGEFYDQETLDGRAIQVRFVIAPQDADHIRFEQAYSADGGKSWEVNWIATDTRLKD